MSDFKPGAERRESSAQDSRAPSKKLFFRRRKVCPFSEEGGQVIDYKDVKMLQKFVSERWRMLPRRITGVSARHQRPLAVAIKRARFLALLPYTDK